MKLMTFNGWKKDVARDVWPSSASSCPPAPSRKAHRWPPPRRPSCRSRSTTALSASTRSATSKRCNPTASPRSFYVNSGTVGGSKNLMSWAQLSAALGRRQRDRRQDCRRDVPRLSEHLSAGERDSQRPAEPHPARARRRRASPTRAGNSRPPSRARSRAAGTGTPGRPAASPRAAPPTPRRCRRRPTWHSGRGPRRGR